MFIKINNNRLQLPIIIVNISKFDIPKNISLYKVYSKSRNKNIPIFVNVIYSENSLHISISYCKRYSKIKYIFSEIIDQLLEE